MKDYSYAPLEGDQIRLIELLPGKPDDDLEASVHIVRLPEDVQDPAASQIFVSANSATVPLAPEYRALSYCWGPKTKTYRNLCIVDGDRRWRIRLRPNLADALKEIRSAGEHFGKYFWVDAICIHQDNNDEKSVQFQKLAMIYNRASSVIVWLGSENGDSSAAMEFVKKLLMLENFDLLTQDTGTSGGWTAFMRLMGRDWFSRRWIVQEIALAKDATLLCGNQTISWREFSTAVSLLAARPELLRKLFQRDETNAGNDPNFLGEVEALGAKSLVDVTNRLLRKSDDGIVMERLFSLEALLSSLTAFEATTEHDIIYSILWLSHDTIPGTKTLEAMGYSHVKETPEVSPAIESRSPIPSPPTQVLANPNYRVKVRLPARPSENGADYFPRASDQNWSTKPVADDSLLHPTSYLPSSRLVSDPNLRSAEEKFVDNPDPLTVDYKKDFYTVCKEALALVMKRSRSLDILCCPWVPEVSHSLPSWIQQLSSAPFDRIPGSFAYERVRADPLVGRPGTGPRIYNASGKTKLSRSRDPIQGRSLVVKGFMLDSIKEHRRAANNGIIPLSWLELVGWDGKSEPVPEKFWRTIVADRGPRGQDQPPAYYPLACKYIYSKKGKRGDLNTDRALNYGQCPSIVSEFLRRVQAVVWSRCLILTEGRKGGPQLLGLVPDEARFGDIICVLYGCSVPVVLRKLREDSAESTGSPVEFCSPPMSREGSDQSCRSCGGSESALVEPDDVSVCTSALSEERVSRQPKLSLSVPNSEERFEFIGECYIHGMMSGEGFKHRVQYGHKRREFRIC